MMKRVTVVEDEGESVAKGMVIADAEVKTVEELKAWLLEDLRPVDLRALNWSQNYVSSKVYTQYDQ